MPTDMELNPNSVFPLPQKMTPLQPKEKVWNSKELKHSESNPITTDDNSKNGTKIHQKEAEI